MSKDDVDKMGHSLTQFAQMQLQDRMSHGVSTILVDEPKEGVASLAEQRRTRNFPYFVRIAPRDLTNWKLDDYERAKRAHVWMPYMVDGDNEFSDKDIERFRVFYPNEYVDWEREAEGAGEFQQMEPMPWWGKTDFVPMVRGYGRRVGPWEGKSSLFGIAELNRRHYQSRSEQDDALAAARDRLLVFQGIEQEQFDENNKTSPQSWLFLPKGGPMDSQLPDVKFVQSNTDGIQAGRQDLEDLGRADRGLAGGHDCAAPASGIHGDRHGHTSQPGDQRIGKHVYGLGG